MHVETVGTPALWAGFTLLILALLAIDLGVFQRKPHAVGVREALVWSGVWVTLSLAFNALVFHWFGTEKGLEFLTGYVIEKALSVDNIFVFVVIFSTFGVASTYQHRVLFWGILGALVMRAGFIVVGAALIQSFHWVMYLFGLVLAYTGVKLLRNPDEEVQPKRNPVYRAFRRFVPATKHYREGRFVVREEGRLLATPLLFVLVAIEASDLVFAVDSIPAIFAVTTDPFIVYTSNIFAILGLRAMYFLLARVLDRFAMLKRALALVLCFVGGKMLVADVYKIPIAASLAVVAALLLGGVLLSLIQERQQPPAQPPAPPPDDPLKDAPEVSDGSKPPEERKLAQAELAGVSGGGTPATRG